MRAPLLSRLWRSRVPVAAGLPDRVDRVYAIGDVHGDLDRLLRLEGLIRADAARTGAAPDRSAILLLGDVIDRGPLSAHLLDHLLRPAPELPERVLLRGNHEQMLLDLLDGRGDPDGWLRLGGEATLRSYELDLPQVRGGRRRIDRLRELMPERHVAFLRAAPLLLVHGGALYSHAGGDPSLPLARQGTTHLLERRARSEEGRTRPAHGLLSVHGHQPVPEPDLSAWRANLDTSAAQPRRITCACVCVVNNNIEAVFSA